MTALSDEILSDLITELSLKDSAEISVLSVKVKNAIREIKRVRNYPDVYTKEKIDKDLENYYSNIRELALYDYNQVGAEGEASHSENGISRTWKDRKECFNGICPFVKVI